MKPVSTVRTTLLVLSFLTAGCLTLRRVPTVTNHPNPAQPRPAEELTVRLETTVAVTNSTAKIKHAAVNAKVSATSTHNEGPGEGPPEALVDGNTGTRWSSDFASPQCVTIDLGKVCNLRTIRLYWEHAYAARYTVSTSMDGRKWAMLHAVVKSAGTTQQEVDTLHITGMAARHIQLDLEKRVNPESGFSLYEIEVKTGE